MGRLQGIGQFIAKCGDVVAQPLGFLGVAFGLGSGGLAQFLHFTANCRDLVAQVGSVSGSSPDVIVRRFPDGPHVLAQGGDVVAEIPRLVNGAFELGDHRRAPGFFCGAGLGLLGIIRTGAPRGNQHQSSKHSRRVSVQGNHESEYSPNTAQPDSGQTRSLIHRRYWNSFACGDPAEN